MLLGARMGLWGGKRTPTARDYVQSGLVAMWDGIENAGWGTHDPNATTWKNLKGDTAWDMSVRAAWQSGGGLYFDGTWCGIAPKTSEQYVTMECVCDGVQESHLLAFGWSYQGMKKRYSLLANASTSLLRCYVVAGVLDGTYTDARSFAFTIGDTSSVIYCDGASKGTSSAQRGETGQTLNHFRLCGYGTTTDTDVSDFFYRGKIYACRIYNRALTAVEIAANYAIDKERFGLP